MKSEACEFCGDHCYGGAEHNARVEDNARYTDAPALAAAPVVQTGMMADLCPACEGKPVHPNNPCQACGTWAAAVGGESEQVELPTKKMNSVDMDEVWFRVESRNKNPRYKSMLKALNALSKDGGSTLIENAKHEALMAYQALEDQLRAETAKRIVAADWRDEYEALCDLTTVRAEAAEARVQELESKLAALSGPVWIPVGERMPDNPGSAHAFLVWCKNDNPSGGYRDMAAYGNFRYYKEDAEGEPDDEGLNVAAFGWNKEEETHGGEYDYLIFDLNDKVSHWMSLPAPPVAESAQQDIEGKGHE